MTHRAVLAAIALAWVASLFLPGADVAGGPSVSGLEVLARGWRGAESGVFAWYANPLFIVALALAAWRFDAAAGALACVACVLALTSFAAAETARGAGVAVPPLSLAAGFYLWLIALIALAAVSWLRVWRRRGTRQ